MTAPPKGFRPHMGLRVQRDAALIMLGLDPSQIDWDHDPAIHLRQWDEEAGDTIPGANDPRFITPRARDDHKVKTKKDVGRIAKVRRLSDEHEAFQRRLSSPDRREKKPSRWPKRGFGKRMEKRT